MLESEAGATVAMVEASLALTMAAVLVQASGMRECCQGSTEEVEEEDDLEQRTGSARQINHLHNRIAQPESEFCGRNDLRALQSPFH